MLIVRRSTLVTAMCAAAILMVVIAGKGRRVSAQVQPVTDPPTRITLSFGQEQVWQPGPDAFAALYACEHQTFTCMREVMGQNGATPDAIAFVQLTGWFLTDLQEGAPVQVGTILKPWRANENTQTALLGGIPPVVYPEQEGSHLALTAQASAEFAGLKRSHPHAIFWAPGPHFERIDTSPQGGQRFIFGYRVLDGCHACTILGYIHVAFDFAPDGTYESAALVESS